MMVWFTVQLEDKPGSLARVAAALGERGVNITGIVGVAEDTDGALMLTTSDPDETRAAFDALRPPVRGARRRGPRDGRDDDRRHARPVGRRRRRADPDMRIATWNVNSHEGPAREDRVVAGARRARRPAHAGDEALRRRRAADDLPDGRLPARPPRRGPLERRRDRRRGTASRSTSRSRTSATGRSATAAPARRRTLEEEDFNPFDEARMLSRPRHAAGRRPDADREPVRAERPRRRLAVLRRQAALVRTGPALARRDPRPEGVAAHRRRPERRADGRATSGTAARVHGGTHVSGQGARGVPEPARLGPPRHLPRPPARRRAAGSPGGTTGPATSTRTSACASTTSCPPSRSRSGSSPSRSTARRARASRSRPTTRRSSSTSTSPACRSTPAGPTRRRESPLAAASARADRRRVDRARSGSRTWAYRASGGPMGHRRRARWTQPDDQDPRSADSADARPCSWRVVALVAACSNAGGGATTDAAGDPGRRANRGGAAGAPRLRHRPASRSSSPTTPTLGAVRDRRGRHGPVRVHARRGRHERVQRRLRDQLAAADGRGVADVTAGTASRASSGRSPATTARCR